MRYLLPRQPVAVSGKPFAYDGNSQMIRSKSSTDPIPRGADLVRLLVVAGVTQDGRIGPATLKAVRAKPHASVIHELCDKRMAFIQRLGTWKTFGKGWSSRVRGVRSEALKMIAPGNAIPTPVASPPVAPAPQEITGKSDLFSIIIAALSAFFKRKVA